MILIELLKIKLNVNLRVYACMINMVMCLQVVDTIVVFPASLN